MAEQRDDHSLLEPGRNCWRLAHADRAAYLVDADAYFRAFVAAAEQAQRSILIAGWDFHSRTRLLCDENGNNCELELGDFLNRLVRQRRDLHIHILIWDYPMIFGFDREWAPLSGFGWKPRRRIHFRYDNTQPISGAHHQKIVVVDDAIAFCGGIDLTCRRWDTCAHAADDTRRVMQGTPYPPFHDLAMAVDGEAALSLGDLVRERWRRATNETLRPVATRSPAWRRIGRKKIVHASWPETIAVSVRDVRVAIARTEPAVNGNAAVREVEQLYLDMIAAAKHSIYIENQYFTADKIGDALVQRLTEEKGPEVIIVIRELSHGWLEELTMQTLRMRLIARLREADRYGRCRVVYPYIAGLKEGTCIDVHSKLLIVDDEYVRIGSANVANRSMGFDTECDVAIHGDREELCDSIRDLRAALLAEHLGAEPERVREETARTGSLHAAIDALQREDRTLKEVQVQLDVSPAVLSVISVADPEHPVALKDLVEILSPDIEPREVKGRGGWVKFAAAICVIAGLTAMWKFTPLAAWLEPNVVTGWARDFGGQWWAPLIVLAAYTPACIVMFPRPVITLFAVVAFGPWLGFVYAMLGIEFAAWLTYVAGQRLSRDTVRRVAGGNLNPLIEVMRRRGLLAMTALRLVPLAPFAVEGVVAGAVRIKLWHFMVGTAIGLLPGTLAATILSDQLQAALESPGDVNYWLIGGALLLLAVATWFVRRWLIGASGQTSSQHDFNRARTA